MPSDAALVDDAISRARTLATLGKRTLLGIAGKPGAGKSTLAAAIVNSLGPDLVRLVPMDGFHLAQAALATLGRLHRKGAPDTFDDAGYVALLKRLQAADEPVAWAPAFHRDIEEPIAGSIDVARDVRLVVTEGNYLLHWPHARAVLDVCWWIECDDGTRLDRLIERHAAFGKSRADAEAWARGSDEANAALIADDLHLADWVITM